VDNNANGPLVGKNVVIRLKTGMKKLGILENTDTTFAYIRYNGELQQIPLVSVDVIYEAK
jgi:hypothetical protein